MYGFRLVHTSFNVTNVRKLSIPRLTSQLESMSNLIQKNEEKKSFNFLRNIYGYAKKHNDGYIYHTELNMVRRNN